MCPRLCSPAVLVLAGTVALASCATDGSITGAQTQSVPQTAPVGIQTTATGPRILVDASRDGGLWWFPQVAPFSSASTHQGKALIDSLRAMGYVVEELPRPFTITSTLLRSYDIVIRAGAFGTYAQAEVAAYGEYVVRGGRLLLLADHMLYAPPDGIAQAFGITFEGITRGDNLLTTFTAHPVTAGLASLHYLVGSGISGAPASALLVGRLSDASYLDLDKNGLQDPGEASAPAVLGVMSSGSGKIVFCGDTNLWETVPSTLLKNVLAWFKE